MNTYPSVLDFGAVADGKTDNAATFMAAFAYMETKGGTLFIPPGNYVVVSPLVIDRSAMTSYADLTRFSILGAGKGNTQITYTGTSGVALTYKGGTTGAGIVGWFTIGGLQIIGTGNAATTGLAINTAALFSVSDAAVLQFGNGISGSDILSARFDDCSSTWNRFGLYCQRSVFSNPNSLVFTNCEISNNSEGGIWLNDPTTCNFIGGGIQNNGVSGSTPNRFGVLINNANSGSDEGAMGAMFSGVYFEGNSGNADIWLCEGGSPGPQNVLVQGCTFNRNSPSVFVPNNIRMDLVGNNASQAMLTVIGNGFNGFNGYVPSGARRCVVVNAGGATAWSFNNYGNLYAGIVDAPT